MLNKNRTPVVTQDTNRAPVATQDKMLEDYIENIFQSALKELEGELDELEGELISKFIMPISGQQDSEEKFHVGIDIDYDKFTELHKNNTLDKKKCKNCGLNSNNKESNFLLINLNLKLCKKLNIKNLIFLKLYQKGKKQVKEWYYRM